MIINQKQSVPAEEYFAQVNKPWALMKNRLGIYSESTIDGINQQQVALNYAGGLLQQQRMIRDKRRTLDKAILYSYQGAYVKRIQPLIEPEIDDWKHYGPVRALINPDKNKMDYDDKIISIGYEHDFHTGDIFEWVGTNTYWLVYLQELTELAYFRAEIRRCSYEIEWLDENGDKNSTFAAIRGPVETKIDYIQKHGISIDNPNYSLHILLPLTDKTYKQFQRYSKFYLQGNNICWRVEATDWISTPNILELTAVEYYANESEDDIENGLVGALKVKPTTPNESNIEILIVGETFIKPKTPYVYTYQGVNNSRWTIDTKKYPITYQINEKNPLQIAVQWESSYSGQFDITYGNFTKTIVVESLF